MFGAGRLENLEREINIRNWGRVLIITDAGLTEIGHPERIENILGKTNIKTAIYNDVNTNPDRSSVLGALKVANNFSPEVLIAVGGGSVMDTAKATGIWYSNQQEDLFALEDPKKRKKSMLPVITIPTTAGTGSEVTSWAVITNNEFSEKISIGGEKMVPDLALVDPELTLTLPEKLTIWTGLDAFTHALEAYISKNVNSYIEDICLLSLQRIVKYLPLIIEDSENLKARTNVMLASMLAGIAMENAGLGLIHGMSHQVSAYYDYQHGLTNAVLLPHVLKFNYHRCKKKIDKFISLVGYKNDIDGFIEDFYKSVNFNESLKIKEKDISQLTEKAAVNVNTLNNSVKPDKTDIAQIYFQAFEI